MITKYFDSDQVMLMVLNDLDKIDAGDERGGDEKLTEQR